MRSTKLLSEEHKLILRALDVLDAIAASSETSGKVEATDVYSILDFLRWFADAHHQAKEETILFPALRTTATQQRPVEHMLVEHSQERALIERLEKDVRLGQLTDFAASAQRLSSTLRNHIYKEDHILFEAADSLLTPEQDQAVFEMMERFDTPFDRSRLEDKLRRLRAYERKYLRKN